MEKIEEPEIKINERQINESAPGQNNTLLMNTGILPNGTKVDWTGKVVENVKWYDKTFFTIDEFKVSNGLFAAGSVSIVPIIGGIAFGVCSFITYRNRKRLAKEIQRVSVHVRRVSSAIRQSITSRNENNK